MFKKLARKILIDEIDSLKEKIKDNQCSADKWYSCYLDMKKKVDQATQRNQYATNGL